MEDLFKKFLYTGVGLVSITADKLQESVKKLVDDEKLTQSEGKKIINEVIEKTSKKKDEFENQLRKITEDVVEKFKFAKNSEYDELAARIEALEAKLGLRAEEVEVPLVKKAPTRKKASTTKKASLAKKSKASA